jgi:para-aminobenzoate synthetase component 1
VANIHLELATSDPQRYPQWGFTAAAPSWIIRCDPITLQTVATHDDRPEASWSDPLSALDWMGRTFPTTTGRWIGYLSYDLGRLFETIPTMAADDLRLPLFEFAWAERADERSRSPYSSPPNQGDTTLYSSTFTRADYQRAVQRCLDYIAAGDVFQVNLAQRFAVPTNALAADIFRNLQRQSPAVLGSLLDFGDFGLISNSPELFLRVTPDRRVITRPIKGTRPRLPGMEIELRDSLKDQAELNMIIDLERNDLGRVCEVGSVRVSEPRSIEAHPTVYHGVATVEGKLRPEVTFVDLLRATFPGGSITGAPKIRAMQIIEELEPVRRGPYCGAIGYVAPDGTMEFNVAIRTMILKDGMVHVPVGGGIVADSDPREEYEETLVKSRAMLAALGVSAPVIA